MNRFLYNLIICLISTNLYSQTRDEFVPFSEVREDIVSEVDVEAEYPDGMGGIMKFFNLHLYYPEVCKEFNVESKFYVRLTIEKDGEVSLIQIRVKNDLNCQQEILKLTQNWTQLMPKWEPAKLNGNDVASVIVFPLTICLR